MTAPKEMPVYLVTGAMGCIGAWVLYYLVRQGKRVVSFDRSDDRHRLDLLLDREEQAEITFFRGDLTDSAQVIATARDSQVTHIIHLAALQVPFCRENPVLGAQVNVVGTVNVFEAARQCGIQHLAYASSVAVYGQPSPEQTGQVLKEAPMNPATLYGVYKIANESTARVYWLDHHISSTGLRPYTVYGVGRDQGITSGPTRAMLAAAAGVPFHIPFNGPCQYHFASDVAQQFIEAAERPLGGAFAFNLGGDAVETTLIVQLIQKYCPGALVTCSETGLPFPAGLDGGPLRKAFPRVFSTPISEGVRKTITFFRNLLASGRIHWE